jgi:sugar phosphate isomerase/epimerase
MKLSVSNLAWEFEDNQKVFKLLNDLDIDMVEGVLTKISSWDLLNIEKIKKYKTFLDKSELNLYSLQSIFYGIDCNGLHDSEIVIPHIKKLIEYSKILNVKILVLGSPNLRKKNISLDEIFKEIDFLLSKTDIQICIEPNARNYGGEYFYNIEQIVEFIKKNNFSKIKTMIDTHNSFLENYNPSIELKKYFEFIEHVHISEPELQPIYNLELHKKFSKTLKFLNYNKTITYELKINNNLEENLKKFISIYN